MAWAFVAGQVANSGAYDGTGTQVKSLAFANPVGSGNFVVVHATWDTTTATLSTITDDKGNTYTLGLSTPIVADNQAHVSYYLWNITNAPQTIHVNFTGVGANFFQMQIAEYSGVQTSGDPIDIKEGRSQAAPGTGANAVSSSAAGTSTTVANDLALGHVLSDAGNSETITAGTSYTNRQTSTASIEAVEDQNIASATATRATFTASIGTGGYSTNLLTFKQAGGPQTASATLAGAGVVTANTLHFGMLGTAAASATTTSVITTTQAIPAHAWVFVVGACATLSRTVSSVSDGTNTYTVLDPGTGVNSVAFSYKANAAAVAASASITTTWSAATGSKTSAAFFVLGISTLNATALDANSADTTGTGTSATSVATGALKQADEIIIAIMGGSATISAFVPGGSYRAANGQLTTTPCQVAFQAVNGTGATVADAPSWTTSTTYHTRVLSFRIGPWLGVVECDGVGVVAGSAVEWMLGTAALAGAGDGTRTAVQWWTTNPATLAGIGAVSCNANPPCQFGSAELDGIGDGTRSAVEWMLGTTTLAGVGAINVPAVQWWTTNPAGLAGVGAIACNANPPCQFGIATLAGSGAVSVSAIEWMLAADALVGVGAINAPMVEIEIALATLVGVGSITDTGLEIELGTATLTGIGSLACNANPPCQFGSAECDGVGAIGVPAVEWMLTTAALAGLGAINVPACQIWRTNPATLGGVGAISCDSHVAGQGTIWTGTAALAGSGTVSAPAVALLLGISALAGAGAVNAPAVYMALGVAALAGSSSVSLDIGHTPAAAAALGGSGALGASGLEVAAGSAVLASGGLLGGTAAMLAAAGAALGSDSACSADAIRVSRVPAGGALVGEGSCGADAAVIIGKIPPAFGSQSPPPGPEIIPSWPDGQPKRSPRWPDGGRKVVAQFPDNDRAQPSWPDRTVSVKTPWPDEAA